MGHQVDVIDKSKKQAVAELGQAQLKLELKRGWLKEKGARVDIFWLHPFSPSFTLHHNVQFPVLTWEIISCCLIQDEYSKLSWQIQKEVPSWVPGATDDGTYSRTPSKTHNEPHEDMRRWLIDQIRCSKTWLRCLVLLSPNLFILQTNNTQLFNITIFTTKKYWKRKHVF